MTKQDTLIIKGIAIIFMIWVHCFNERLTHVHEYHDFIICGDNLSFLLTRLTRPVEFYVILGGYGLYFTYINKKSIGWKNRLKKLYKLYGFTLLIFVPLAFLLGVDGYPGSIRDIIINITGWNTTYNATIWFLFPYSVIIAIAEPLFKLFDDKPVHTFLGSIALYFGAYLTSWMKHHGYVSLDYALKEVLRVMNMVMPFLIGAVLCKYSIVSKTKILFEKRQIFLFLFLLILCAVRLSTDFDFVIQLVYSTSLIVGVSSARKSEFLSNLLFFFGKHSTSMWLVHAYFIWYLFEEYPYSLKYPILIFGVSLLESVFAALLIDWSYLKITQFVQKKNAE